MHSPHSSFLIKSTNILATKMCNTQKFVVLSGSDSAIACMHICLCKPLNRSV